MTKHTPATPLSRISNKTDRFYATHYPRLVAFVHKFRQYNTKPSPQLLDDLHAQADDLLRELGESND